MFSFLQQGMKAQTLLLVVLALLAFACKEAHMEHGKIKMNLTYEIIQENLKNNLYVLKWKDTLGLSKGYLPNNYFNRPKEVWCIITEKENDTIGYYCGSSMPRSYCYFTPTDSLVTLKFMVGFNILPKKFESDTLGMAAYLKASIKPKEFEPIHLNIRSDNEKQFEKIIKEKHYR